MPDRKRDRIQVTEENGLRSAPSQLEALKAADEATHCLVSLIEELEEFQQDDSPYAKIQQASATITAMAYRTARACMLVIAAGYAPESFPLKRRVSEAVLLVEHITADIYGNRAKEWLEGRKPSFGTLTSKKPARAKILNRYSTGSHIDLRTMPRPAIVSTLKGERTKGFPLSGTREPELANHLLIELAIECRKLAYDFAWYVLDRLAAWKAAAPSTAKGSLMFPADGGEWTTSALNNWRNRVFAPLAPEGATPYSLRHGYALMLAREGVDDRDAADRMGHSLTMHNQHYGGFIRALRGKPRESMEAAAKRARAAAVLPTAA